jgi:putative ABC transport system substrate-binding protein
VPNRRDFVGACAGSAALSVAGVRAQAPASRRVARIGVLALRPPDPLNTMNAALLEGLRAAGYVEGRSLELIYPDAQGREERLTEIAQDLVRRRVDLILVIGPAPLAAARKATSTTPLVMVASSADPVAEGLARSLSRPGGNVTGLTYAEPDRFKKQLELLKATAGRVSRLCVLWDFNVEIYKRDWAAPLASAGRTLGIEILEPVVALAAGDLPAAFATLRQRRADAIHVASGGALLAARDRVAALALEQRLPGIAAFREFAQAGLLMSYGPDLADINRRAGGFVDRILKGGKPGDIAIELPAKFDLVINQKTAKALGIAVPQPVLMRATDVIST